MNEYESLNIRGRKGVEKKLLDRSVVAQHILVDLTSSVAKIKTEYLGVTKVLIRNI
jgi:hypothetical protein